MLSGKNRKFVKGFTLLEVMVVVSILMILAFMAVPSQLGKINKERILKTIELVEPYKANIETIYRLTGEFPADNEAASIPEPEKIIGNYLKSMKVKDGAMHLVLGQKLKSLEDKILTIYPVYVKDSPASPISWVCGYDEPPTGVEAAGENETSVPRPYLPFVCI